MEVKVRGCKAGYKGRNSKGNERVVVVPKVACLSYENLYNQSNLTSH